MKLKKILGLAVVMLSAIGMGACGGSGGGGSTPADPTHKHEYKDVADDPRNVAATCAETGKQVKKCDCGEEKVVTVAKLPHKYVDDSGRNKAASCTEAGVANAKKCSECGAETQEVIEALGHDWVDDADQGDAKAPDCYNGGEVKQHCTRCPETQTIESDPLGHTFGNAEFASRAEGEEKAAVTKLTCDRGDVVRYTWAASEVTTACEAGYDVGEAHEANVAVAEDGGTQFWGRPKGNAVVLDESGNASQDNHDPVYDASVAGSYMEYKFNLTEAISGAKIIADINPAMWLDGTGGMFKGVGVGGDWTPGLKGVNEGGSVIAYAGDDWRMEVYIDGQQIALAGNQEASAGRGYYHFPTAEDVSLTAGEHTFKMVMTGGWKHTYYRFGFELAAK